MVEIERCWLGIVRSNALSKNCVELSLIDGDDVCGNELPHCCSDEMITACNMGGGLFDDVNNWLPFVWILATVDGGSSSGILIRRSATISFFGNCCKLLHYQLSACTVCWTEWLVVSKCSGIGTGRERGDCFFCLNLKKQNGNGWVRVCIFNLTYWLTKNMAKFEFKLTFLRNGKHPGFSTSGGALINRSGVGPSLTLNTFNSLKHSVSTISVCHEIDTEPVLNFA